MPILELQNIAYEHGGKAILEGISLSVAPGDFISIVGPSGSGKSTLLRLCGHLISPTKGTILFDGKPFADHPPTELRKRVAYCFQTPQLFGDTVMQNMLFPYAIRKMKPDTERMRALFARFQMPAEFLDRDTRNLSGGEKQRIALIRCLLFMPQILLLDEVTSSLDADNAQIVEDVIASLNKEGITVLWVTHDEAQSRKYAKKLLTIDAGRAASLEELDP